MAKKNNDNSVTIKDIASLCEVSISTVSNVLNGKTQKVSADVCQKVLEAVKKYNYRPNYLAKNLRAMSTKTIGVIAEDLILFSTAPIIEGIMKICEERGYNVVIENMRLFGRWSNAWMKDETLFQSAFQPVLLKMESMNVDGIIYVGGLEHVIKQFTLLDNIPIVMAYSTPENKDIPSFRLDDENGALEAIDYLFSKGHKNIGIITGEQDNLHTINRMIGIQKAFFKKGVLFDPNLVSYQHWNKEGGYDGMKALLDKNITAVFCMSDIIAAGAYAALRENGLEPGVDVSVIGFDNQEISAMLSPSLTTMAVPLEEIGSEAVAELIEKCGNKESLQNIEKRISPKLIERDSVKTLS